MRLVERGNFKHDLRVTSSKIVDPARSCCVSMPAHGDLKRASRRGGGTALAGRFKEAAAGKVAT